MRGNRKVPSNNLCGVGFLEYRLPAPDRTLAPWKGVGTIPTKGWEAGNAW